jgi:hypothetical protein
VIFFDVFVNGLIIYYTIVELVELVELVKFVELVVETIYIKNICILIFKKIDIFYQNFIQFSNNFYVLFINCFK